MDSLLIFKADIDWSSARPALSGTRGEADRLAALLHVKRQIVASRDALIPALRELGLIVKTVSQTMPSLTVRGTPEQLRNASRLAGVVSLRGSKHMMPEAYAAKNGVSDPGIDASFNASNFFGAGQKIGSYETAGEGVYDPHEAFQFVTTNILTGDRISYQEEPRACPGNINCYGLGSKCLPLNRNSALPKQCVMDHNTSVLSVASGSNGGLKYGAARSLYYVANSGGDRATGLMQCDMDSELGAYDWFVEKGVRIVNESFGCWAIPDANHPNPYDSGAYAEGTVQDYYARHYDMLITKAAGNNDDQPACPYTNNSLCVGTVKRDSAGIPCHASTKNNNLFPGGTRSDREEPDVVAFGGDFCDSDSSRKVDLASLDQPPSAWKVGTGTSFAAPQAAALAALCQEARGAPMSALSLRSVEMLSGFVRNVADFNYSTSSTNLAKPDWRDGAGGIDGSLALGLCTGDTIALDPGPLTGVRWPAATTHCADCNNNDPPFGGLSVAPRSAVTPSSSDGRVYRFLGAFDLVGGDRLRYLINWNSCPSNPQGLGAAPVATDYDLFLLKKDDLVYSSQSVYDTNEGFDVTIPAGADDTYQVLVGFPANSKGCDGGGDEPFAAGYLVGH